MPRATRQEWKGNPEMITLLPRNIRVSAILQDVTNGLESKALIVHESIQPVYTVEGTLKMIAATAALLPEDMRITIYIQKENSDE